MQNMNPFLVYPVSVCHIPEPDALCLLVGSNLFCCCCGAIRIAVPDGLLILSLEGREAGRPFFEAGGTQFRHQVSGVHLGAAVAAA